MSRISAFVAALLPALIGLPSSSGAAEAVVLQLSGPPQFEFAGYYAAQWLGYYRDAGLDVTIKPGGLKAQIPIDPVREVAEGRAQFGIGSTQLVIRRAQGLPILLVAPVFQQSGAAVYYRADSDFSSPAALVNARVGRLPASDILDIELATTLRAEGIDPSRMKSVTIDPGQIVPALADKTIDAAIGSAWIVPWQAHERGIVLKSFNPAGYRVGYYGDSIFTMERFEAAEPETVKNFRAASLMGWQYALEHPNEVVARLIADKPGTTPAADAAGFDNFQADVAHRLSRYPDIPLGYSKPDRWTQIEAGMLAAGALQHSADLTRFVYSPAVERPLDDPGTGEATTSLRYAPIGAAAVVAVLAGALWLGWRFVRRPRVAATESASAAATSAATAQKPAPVLPIRPVSRRTAPPAPAVSPPTDLNAVLGPLERRIRRQARGKVRCRYSLLAELWPCRTDASTVATTVLDLTEAAIAVMGVDGTLIVGTRNFTFDEANLADYPDGRIGQFARITVRDSGTGLTDDELDGIADLEKSARPAIARASAVMKRLGGFLRVESAENVGTAVHLYFTRVTDAAELPQQLPTAQVAE